MRDSLTESLQIGPRDEFNEELLGQVRPENRQNPEPKQSYHLVVIGAGTAGLVAAAAAAGLGASVALIEQRLMGGDCLNFGCVPSKALIAAARSVDAIRRASSFGIRVAEPQVDFPSIMERMRRLRAEISSHDSAERFSSLGVDVFFGQAGFSGPNVITVGEKKLVFRKVVIATGSRPKIPSLAGIKNVPFYTNETNFSLTELPQRLVILGAGPNGCEMAQAFARFGSNVTLVTTETGVLPRDDREGAALIAEALREDGVSIRSGGETAKVSHDGSEISLQFSASDNRAEVRAEALLLAVGREPNVEGLNLPAVGVEYSKDGISVNDYLQTTNPNIYAAGDVCLKHKFTHAADFSARVAVQNALFSFGPIGKKKISSLQIPWCTYTSPEIARIGMQPHDAETAGIEIQTFTKAMKEVDRARLDGETEGFVKIHVKKGSGRILGATIVGERAGDLIAELSLALCHGITLAGLAETIHPYPTQAEAIRQTGDLYQRSRLTPAIKRLLSLYFRLK